MMVIIGAIIVIGVIYLLLKRHESRMVLIAAGILMAVLLVNLWQHWMHLLKV